jgi:hypothetical protein
VNKDTEALNRLVVILPDVQDSLAAALWTSDERF